MRRTIVGAVVALVLALSANASAGPKGDRARFDDRDPTLMSQDAFTCNSAGASSLLVGAAVIGLVARRRR